MKKYLLLLLLTIMGITAFSQIQQIKIGSFVVKSQLPSKIDSWASVPGALLLVAQKLPNARVEGVRLILQIKSGGSIICGSNASNGLQVDNFTTRTFSAQELIGLLAGCKELKDGTYSLCAQFINIDRVAISNEMCKDFTVETPKDIDYAPPTLINPDNGKKYKAAELQRPVTFRWTPLVPKPKEPVTYRLRVWQLMQGQNGTAAMKANQPLIDKEVREVTQTTVSSIITGPCRPPYLCDFIWNVQAVNHDGKPMGRNNGNSEPYTFKILDDNINIKIDSVHIGCCIDGKQSIYVKVSNLHLTNPAQITAIKYRVNGTGPLTTLSPTTPATPFTITANNAQVFTASINCADTMNTIKFIVDAIWPTDPDNINNETAWDTLHCACNACDEKHFSLNAPAPDEIKFANNIISFNQPITITTTPAKTIKTIKADLVYFEMVPENDYCIPCNKDAAAYGHFTNGSNSISWTGQQQALNFNITTPQLTPCCSATFRWCIRYKTEFTDCTTCSKVVCYEKKQEGCINPLNNNPK